MRRSRSPQGGGQSELEEDELLDELDDELDDDEELDEVDALEESDVFAGLESDDEPLEPEVAGVEDDDAARLSVR